MPPRCFLTTSIAGFCTLISLAFAASGNDQALLTVPEARQLLRQHCVQCHGGEETYAGVNLALLETELDVWKDRLVWSRAQLMLEAGEMPPDDGPPLDDKNRAALTRWIEYTLDHIDVDRIPRDAGFVPPRRLTGKQYNYTVQDLFGLDGPVYDFPDDLVIGDSFENSADMLRFDALWLEKALEAADATVRAVWSNPAAMAELLAVRPSPPPVEDDALYVATPEVSQLCDTGGDFSIVAQVVGRPERLFLRSPPGADDILGSKEWILDGDALIYRISRRRALVAADLDIEEGQQHWIGLTVRGGRASLYLDGRLLASRPRLTRPDMPGHRLKIGFQEEEDEDEEDEDEEEERGEDQEHEDEDGDAQPAAEERDRIETFLFYAGGLSDEVMRRLHQTADEADLPTATFRWTVGMETPLPENFVTVEDATEVVLRDFLGKAFRRTPSRETLDRYTSLLQDGLDAGLTFEIALQHPVATALASPEFLLLSDSGVESEGIQALPAVDLSNRLSYFLWSSLPDDALRSAAECGSLTEPEELLRQVDRMLADVKANRFIESFVLQWLRTEGLGRTIRPSADSYPEVTDAVLESMRREGPVYFADAVANNHSLLNLISSSYSLVDQALAEHYGFGDVVDSQWRRVDHSDGERGGVLTQAAVLTVTSSPQRTSPVFRGKWILEVLLGDPPPPPPPNVPPLPAPEAANPTSLRESLELHRGQEACAGCHSRIDPYGLALEQYNAVGGLRTTPQDTRTTLHTGEVLHGAEDLKRHLLASRKDDFLRHVIRKMLAYALGRELQLSDERAVHEIMDGLKQNDFGARTLIYEVVLSEPFRYRQIPAPNRDAPTD